MKPSQLKNLNSSKIEICNECGRNVKMGTGFFVNRVVNLDNEVERIEAGKPSPWGAFMCAECDTRIYS